VCVSLILLASLAICVFVNSPNFAVRVVSRRHEMTLLPVSSLILMFVSCQGDLRWPCCLWAPLFCCSCRVKETWDDLAVWELLYSAVRVVSRRNEITLLSVSVSSPISAVRVSENETTLKSVYLSYPISAVHVKETWDNLAVCVTVSSPISAIRVLSRGHEMTLICVRVCLCVHPCAVTKECRRLVFPDFKILFNNFEITLHVLWNLWNVMHVKFYFTPTRGNMKCLNYYKAKHGLSWRNYI
jgi:hypothetical protein